MAGQGLGASSPEVFVLYNERQPGIDAVVRRLRELDIPLYYFKEDLPPGGVIVDTESPRFASAPVVLLLLGSAGWGPSQRTIAYRAVKFRKTIIPAVVSDPPMDPSDELGDLVLQRRWFDLSENLGEVDQLGAALREALANAKLEVTAPRFDEIINTLVDGNDLQRAVLVDYLAQQDIPDRAALATRLRETIRNDFAPRKEASFASARRDPKFIPSARGWMLSALICVDPDSESSKQLILEHLDADLEPERTVRFWTLAGTIQRAVSYVDEALQTSRRDFAPEVQLLAHIASSPNDIALQQPLTKALRSPSYEEAWSALCALRVAPVTSLTAEVIGQLERRPDSQSLTYDALLALAPRDVARAAQPLLAKEPGIDRLAELVLREARVSSPLARRSFARVLAAFDIGGVEKVLYGHAAGPDDRKIVQALLDDIAQQRRTSDETPIAGYATDTIDIFQDDIGIRRDVETLASVMMAREVVPPLAIGLFGEWGSGKSFFMQSIHAAAGEIANRAKLQGDSPFCSDIVQIRFNAWHYVDSSLWASLVSHILDELSGHFSPKQDDAAKLASLTSDLNSVKSQVAEAEAARASATEQLKQSSEELQKSILERERRELRLRDLRAGDLAALLNGDSDLKETITKATDQAGIPLIIDSVAEFNRVVDESYSVGGRVAVFARSIFKGPSPYLVILGMVLCLTVPSALGAFLLKIKLPDLSTFAEMASRIALVVGSATTVVRVTLNRVKKVLDALAAAKGKVDKQLAAKRVEPSEDERTLEAQVAAARANEKAAIERVSVASARAKELEDRVASLQQSRSLGYFVNERSRSDDYRRHLGLISVIRRDFDGLVERLRAPDAMSDVRVDRIILYIDDVDRCPPHMVVDILQAVHLLLAYDLFVVVVSVDPRWLMRSLAVKFSHLDVQKQSSMDGSAATPKDYLEKIFQIPFSVRPMNDQAFGRMMKRLLTPPQPEFPGKASVANDAHQPEAVEFPEGRKPLPVADDGLTAVSEPISPMHEPRDLSRSMTISAVEADFAGSLHAFFPTPRSAKRFANVYRLLKASVAQQTLSKFEGVPGAPGEFRLPMLLLAALVGDSTSASVLFPKFLAGAEEDRDDWWGFADQLPVKAHDTRQLRERIRAVADSPLFPRSPQLVRHWLPIVARFSFLTARLFMDRRIREDEIVEET